MEKRIAAEKRITVHYPAELHDNEFRGELFGIFHESSQHYNVLAYGTNPCPDYAYLGVLSGEDEDTGDPVLKGWRENGTLKFHRGGIACVPKPYELVQNIFSRNTGILETDCMLKTSVLLTGIGSVGSLAALELARSGVGRFLLIDNDTLEYHNICRHQCGILDVGSYKTDAVKKRILHINPSAEVHCFEGILEDVPQEIFERFIDKGTLIIGCADNREGNLYANSIAAHYEVPFLSIGFWERAAAGEIFYTIPGEMPCYECVFGNSRETAGNVPSANRRFYTNQEDIRKTNFEPGIATDINFVTGVGIKLALDLLNRNNPRFTPRVIHDLKQLTLVCNTNNTDIGGGPVEIFSYPLQITRSIDISRSDTCTVCPEVPEEKNERNQ